MFDGQTVYYTDQNLAERNDLNQNDQQSLAEAENKFMHFVRETKVGNTYIYREQLRANAQRGNFHLRINMKDLNAFDDTLSMQFRNQPSEFMKIFESAIETIYRVDYYND